MSYYPIYRKMTVMFTKYFQSRCDVKGSCANDTRTSVLGGRSVKYHQNLCRGWGEMEKSINK